MNQYATDPVIPAISLFASDENRVVLEKMFQVLKDINAKVDNLAVEVNKNSRYIAKTGKRTHVIKRLTADTHERVRNIGRKSICGPDAPNNNGETSTKSKIEDRKLFVDKVLKALQVESGYITDLALVKRFALEMAQDTTKKKRSLFKEILRKHCHRRSSDGMLTYITTSAKSSRPVQRSLPNDFNNQIDFGTFGDIYSNEFQYMEALGSYPTSSQPFPSLQPLQPLQPLQSLQPESIQSEPFASLQTYPSHPSQPFQSFQTFPPFEPSSSSNYNPTEHSEHNVFDFPSFESTSSDWAESQSTQGTQGGPLASRIEEIHETPESQE